MKEEHQNYKDDMTNKFKEFQKETEKLSDLLMNQQKDVFKEFKTNYRTSFIFMKRSAEDAAEEKMKAELQRLDKEIKNQKEKIDENLSSESQTLHKGMRVFDIRDGKGNPKTKSHMKELQKKVQKMMDWLESQEIHSEEQVQEKLKKVIKELKNNDDAADDVFEKFAEVCERLESMREAKKALETEQAKCIDKNRGIKRTWIATMEMLVGKINDRFLEFFRKINCEGRVQFGPVPKELLDCTYNNPEIEYHDEDDFRNYGILIFVKFRKTQALQLLSPTQSGGERSVSTMLYLLSMQEVTRAPFRLIDEINQGMDNRNERMVMECLADM